MEKFKFKSSWWKQITPWAIALGGMLSVELSAVASPKTIEIAQVRSRAIAPTPLNITPRTHISLPQSNSNYYYHTDISRGRGNFAPRVLNRDRYQGDRSYRDCDRDYRHSRRRRSKSGITVIIDAPSNNSIPTGGNYIRVVR